MLRPLAMAINRISYLLYRYVWAPKMVHEGIQPSLSRLCGYATIIDSSAVPEMVRFADRC